MRKTKTLALQLQRKYSNTGKIWTYMSTYMVSKKILNPLKNKGTSKLTNLHSFRVVTCECKINTKIGIPWYEFSDIFFLSWIFPYLDIKHEVRTSIIYGRKQDYTLTWQLAQIRYFTTVVQKWPSTLNPILEIYHSLFQMSTRKLTDCYTQRAWLGEYNK